MSSAVIFDSDIADFTLVHPSAYILSSKINTCVTILKGSRVDNEVIPAYVVVGGPGGRASPDGMEACMGGRCGEVWERVKILVAGGGGGEAVKNVS